MSCTFCDSPVDPTPVFPARELRSDVPAAAHTAKLGIHDQVAMPQVVTLPTRLAQHNGGRRKLVIVRRDQVVEKPVRDHLRSNERTRDWFVVKKVTTKAATKKVSAEKGSE